MNADLGQPIAYGRTAEIYAWHPGHVLKLFYDWFGLENIEHEARISQSIHASGLPAPAVSEILRVNNRFGLVYQRVYGESMFKMVQRQPWNVFRYGWRMAELQAEIHNSTIDADLPSQRKKLERNIRQAKSLTSSLRRKVFAALEMLPDGDRLCHGDFWPGNILVTTQGEMIIDWIHATRGNPLVDLARTTNLVIGFATTSQIRRPFLSFNTKGTRTIKNSFFQVFCRLCYPAYINYYFKLCPFDRDEYNCWLPIVAAARLVDDIPELEQMLIAQVKQNL